MKPWQVRQHIRELVDSAYVCVLSSSAELNNDGGCSMVFPSREPWLAGFMKRFVGDARAVLRSRKASFAFTDREYDQDRCVLAFHFSHGRDIAGQEAASTVALVYPKEWRPFLEFVMENNHIDLLRALSDASGCDRLSLISRPPVRA